MYRTTLTILSCFLVACSLNAQEVDLKIPSAVKPKAPAQPLDLDDELESSSDVNEVKKSEDETTPTEDTAQPADTNEATEEAASEEASEVENEEAATDEGAEADGSKEAVDSESEEATDGEDSEESVGEIEKLDVPVFVTLNEEGQLIGQATAMVSGEPVPVEANVSLVRNGVLLSKIVANEDGSFAFPSIAPGEYNMYGSASSYCGRQTFTVRQTTSCDVCQESVPLRLTQGGGCYSGYSSAPAASFSSGSIGGIAGGGGGGFFGGGLAGGGGGAIAGRSALRFLGLGGVITAIAVGDSDDLVASPGE